MMNTSDFMIPFFILIFHQFLIPFSIANPSGEDNMLIAFMKGHPNIQISEYSKQKYMAFLGILYFMRKNWQFGKIGNKFEEYELTECQKYRKYLDILYEYLYREYAEIPTVKPKFVFQKQIQIEGPIIYALNCLARISHFYFKKWVGKQHEYKLKMFNYNANFEPKLLNEDSFNYLIELEKDQKVPINKKFEEYLGKMFKNAVENAKKDDPAIVNELNDDKHLLIWDSKFDDQAKWKNDALFLEYVKGLATNFMKFSKMAEEYSNDLCRMEKEEGYIDDNDQSMINFGLCETEKMEKHLKQKYEAHFGVLYLMRENWQCDKNWKKINEYKLKECQKYRKYLDILYAYLCQLYVEGKNAEISKKISIAKPIFFSSSENEQKELISVVQALNNISQCFLGKTEYYNKSNDMVLKNEDDFIDKDNWFSKFIQQNVMAKINGPKNEQKKGKKILGLSNESEDNLRQEFEHKMQKLYENTKEKAKEENDKLEKAFSKAKDDRETNEQMRVEFDEFNDKFGTFNESPFSKSFY